MQDLGVLDSQNGFFLGILLRVSRKDIGNSIGLTLAIIDPEIVLRQLQSPTNLPRA